MFCFEKEFTNFSYYKGALLVSAHRFRTPFLKRQIFPGIFGVLPIDYSIYDKTILGIFVYLRSYNNKSQFSFLQTVQSSRNTSYLRTSHFCAKC